MTTTWYDRPGVACAQAWLYITATTTKRAMWMLMALPLLFAVLMFVVGLLIMNPIAVVGAPPIVWWVLTSTRETVAKLAAHNGDPCLPCARQQLSRARFMAYLTALNLVFFGVDVILGRSVVADVIMIATTWPPAVAFYAALLTGVGMGPKRTLPGDLRRVTRHRTAPAPTPT